MGPRHKADRGAKSGYIPYEPQEQLHRMADGVWTVEGPVVAYGRKPFQVPCPTRMTVLRLNDGSLALHSPVAFTDRLFRALEGVGPIRTLIGPNSFHHLHLASWAKACSQARIFVPRRLDRNDLPAERTHALLEGLEDPFAGTLDYVEFDGGWTELVFLHRPSRTAVFTDLIQNFELSRVQGLLAKTLLHLAGASGDPPRASIEMRASAILCGRKKQVASSVRRIKDWHPDRVLIAHGAQLDGNADNLLEEAFRWTS